MACATHLTCWIKRNCSRMTRKRDIQTNIWFSFLSSAHTHRVHGYKSNDRLSKNWSKSNGYSKNITSRAYPRRVFSTREKLVLNLKLSGYNHDNHYPAEGKGFKVRKQTQIVYMFELFLCISLFSFKFRCLFTVQLNSHGVQCKIFV